MNGLHSSRLPNTNRMKSGARLLKPRSIVSILWLVAISTAALSASPVPPPVSGEADIAALLEDRIDLSGTSVGIVVGIVDREGRRIISHGRAREGKGSPPDGDSIFEIGSVTKVFTALVLADMVQKGEVRLSDPVSKYLPPDVTVPSQAHREITLADLATHTSGLPSVPDNAASDMHNPFRGYTTDKAFEFLGSYKLTYPIGTQYVYSNFGMGLLGHALERRAGCDYEELIRSRITGPLQMTSTYVNMGAGVRERLVQGYFHPEKPAGPWTIESLQGMGALHSTVNDLLRFLSINLGLESHPMSSALALTHVGRTTGKTPDQEIALGWHIDHRFNNTIIWHNGLTTGFRSYIAIDPLAQRGVVVLSNTGVPIEDIGRHVLDERFEVKRYGPPKSLVKLVEKHHFQDMPSVYSSYIAREPAQVATEDQLNQWGYSLLWRKRPTDAIAVLGLAITLFPASSNLQESLGEAQEANGQSLLAIESYRRALAINPSNEHAKSRLKVLAAEMKSSTGSVH